MRILGIADPHSSHTHKWANYLSERGYALHLVSYTPLRPDARQGLLPGVALEPWTLPGIHLKRPWVTLEAVRRLRQLARRLQPTLTHAHFLGAGAWYAALAGCRPLVTSVMGGGDIRGTSWRPQSLRERVLTPFALRRSALVLCWSPNLKTVVAPLVPARVPVEVMVGGVDVFRFSPGPPDEALRRELRLDARDFVVLSPRLFWPLQNIDTIVRAFGKLVARGVQARLLLVRYRADAEPAYASAVDGLVDSLGLREFVRMIPSIRQEDMPRYYRTVQCTLSVPDTDGTPMTVMESLACETPAVVSDLADYDSELFSPDTVLRVPAKDAPALADALERLATQPSLGTSLGAKGRELVEGRANYRTEMGRLEAIYSRLAAGIHARQESQ
jgi:glycosyltransferase involved in cell wall biosynthesis